jgi:hypothetical protein
MTHDALQNDEKDAPEESAGVDVVQPPHQDIESAMPPMLPTNLREGLELAVEARSLGSTTVKAGQDMYAPPANQPSDPLPHVLSAPAN